MTVVKPETRCNDCPRENARGKSTTGAVTLPVAKSGLRGTAWAWPLRQHALARLRGARRARVRRLLPRGLRLARTGREGGTLWESRSGDRVRGLSRLARDRSGKAIGECLAGPSYGRECWLRREAIVGSRVRRPGHGVSRRDAGYGRRGERVERRRAPVFLLLFRERVVIGVV